MAANPNPLAAEGDAALHAPPGFLVWVAELVHSHRDRLLAYARKCGLDAEEALDAVQDGFVSFLRVPQARSVAREGEEALKLLTVLVRGNVQNQRRKRARRRLAQPEVAAQVAHADTESSETLISRAEELARVEGCILRMGRLQRQVVQLSLLDERPHQQVAETLGISDGYARVLLHRAREHVRNCSFRYDEDPSEENL